jgi:His/Glu/Gln/Arg/opine family amino acid ABC transporter permease subunit
MVDAFEFLAKNLPHLIWGFPGQRPGGLVLSVLLALAGVGLGFILANVVAILRATSVAPLLWFTRLYVEVFRGLPLLLILLLVYQVIGSPRFGLNLSPHQSVVVALALYSGAYQAEILRAGLASVPTQYIESARVMGSSQRHAYRTIQLRYALRVMLPAFTGQAISLFKDTSVVVVVAVPELMTVANVTLGGDVRNAGAWVPLYLLVGFLYFAVAVVVSRLVRRWERMHPAPGLIHSFISY